jgi:hypothetical protein
MATITYQVMLRNEQKLHQVSCAGPSTTVPGSGTSGSFPLLKAGYYTVTAQAEAAAVSDTKSLSVDENDTMHINLVLE